MEQITIDTVDGYALAASLYRTDKNNALQKLAIINSGTAILRSYYESFAIFLQHQGFDVLTYDYRGVGNTVAIHQHAPEPTMLDWGLVDMNTVLDYAVVHFPGHRIVGVGHSFGGQILGIVPNCNRFDAFLGIAAQNVSIGNYPWLKPRLIASFFFYLLRMLYYVPGYLPRWVLGSEPLGKTIIKDWARFSLNKAYLADLQGRPIRDGFESFTGRLQLCAMSDDIIFAPELTVRALGDLYLQTEAEIVVLTPKAYAVKAIDHFGYFKQSMNPQAWQEAAQWLAG